MVEEPEKKEWPSKTPVTETPGEAMPAELASPEIEECDPMTMNCNEMPKHMAELTKRSELLGTGLKKLEDINETIPSSEGRLLYAKTIDEKSRVDGKIEDIVLRFSRCTLSEETKEEEPEETPPE